MNTICSQLAAKSPGPGRPKDLEKRAAILAAAKQLFPDLGFEGTSMDAVAAAAGVSKLTVYSHFNDKESLFVEAVRARCEEQMPLSLFGAALQGPVADQLMVIARAFFALISNPQSISLHRLLTSGTNTSNKLAQMFWQVGPMQMHDGFAEFLGRASAAGSLQIEDPMRASSQFFSLLKGEVHARLLFGCREHLTDADIEDHLKATVDVFVRAYSPR